MQRFNFHWNMEHFDHGIDHYFVEGIPSAQHAVKGGSLVVDEDGRPVFEPVLINVKELLECEDSTKYLGSRFVF